jgi:hypothetical protein
VLRRQPSDVVLYWPFSTDPLQKLRVIVDLVGGEQHCLMLEVGGPFTLSGRATRFASTLTRAGSRAIVPTTRHLPLALRQPALDHNRSIVTTILRRDKIIPKFCRPPRLQHKNQQGI